MGLSKSQNVIATLPGWKSLEMYARLPIGTFWRFEIFNFLIFAELLLAKKFECFERKVGSVMCWMVIGILLLTLKGFLSAPINNEGEPNKREKRQVEETGKTGELPKKTGEEEMPENKSDETFRDKLDKISEIFKNLGIFMQNKPNKREKRQVEKTGRKDEDRESESDETFRDKLDKVSQVLKEYFGIFMQKMESDLWISVAIVFVRLTENYAFHFGELLAVFGSKYFLSPRSATK
ncbi:uncharacterized protein TNIN_322101 [Trichonephila inaurata madagascariensis]|uniref:Uncharacterized protein n=1 Tax=Trichonephila inaurata madagascariensis TaxID=2747483 RepID=A0A8X6YPQ6_9ARAC|nr:uncharacterized protein TNIN_322101 [Trichonephila inaurata madagascariensis]